MAPVKEVAPENISAIFVTVLMFGVSVAVMIRLLAPRKALLISAFQTAVPHCSIEVYF